VELALALRARWGKSGAAVRSLTLVDASAGLLPNLSAAGRTEMADVLSGTDSGALPVRVIAGAAVSAVGDGRLSLAPSFSPSSASGAPPRTLRYTLAIWATGAAPGPLLPALGRAGVRLCDDGWIEVGPTLRSTSVPNVYAGGDCVTIVGLPDGRPSPPKAGVYAVRAGPPLLQNIAAEVSGRGPGTARFVPQDDFLRLVMCGDGTAVGFRFGMALRGRWVWEMKDAIDRSFTDGFRGAGLVEWRATDTGTLGEKQYDAGGYGKGSEVAAAMDAEEAAGLLARTDDDVEYEVAWAVLRRMATQETFRERVLALWMEEWKKRRLLGGRDRAVAPSSASGTTGENIGSR